MTPSVASDLVQNCLHMSHKKYARPIAEFIIVYQRKVLVEKNNVLPISSIDDVAKDLV